MPVKAENTIARIVDAWLIDIESRCDLAAVTKEEYARSAQRLVAWGGHRSLARLDLNAYVLHRRAMEAAPRTIRQDVIIARILWKWAKEDRRLKADAILRVPRLRVDPEKFVANHYTPTPGEAAKVFEAMPDDDWRLVAVTLARTGARLGEVVSLRSCDLDLHTGRLALGAVEGASKTGLRWFPLDTDTLKVLGPRAGRGKDPLFDFTGERVRERPLGDPPQALRHRLTRACERAGVPRITPHGLRRMVVTRLMRARVDAAAAAALTGHSVSVMLRYYRQVSDDDRRDAAERANLGVLADTPRKPTDRSTC